MFAEQESLSRCIFSFRHDQSQSRWRCSGVLQESISWQCNLTNVSKVSNVLHYRSNCFCWTVNNCHRKFEPSRYWNIIRFIIRVDVEVEYPQFSAPQQDASEHNIHPDTSSLKTSTHSGATRKLRAWSAVRTGSRLKRLSVSFSSSMCLLSLLSITTNNLYFQSIILTYLGVMKKHHTCS